MSSAPNLPAYAISSATLQAVVHVLAGLPWAQVNHAMAPLHAEIQAQEAAAVQAASTGEPVGLTG